MSIFRSSTPDGWRKMLDALSPRKEGGRIPAFFFGHGSPALLYDMGMGRDIGHGVGGPLHTFLREFGPALIKKYNPKGIVVFSAHFETRGDRLVTDYGDDQPLLFDYYGFDDKFYKFEWHSNGSHPLTERLVSLFNAAGLPAHKTTITEARGQCGKTGQPAPGLDHGVFVPFKLMFPEGNTGTFPIPIVLASIDSSLDPKDEMAIGAAISSLRNEGILILSGGLTIHTFRDFKLYQYETSNDDVKDFQAALVAAAEEQNNEKRLQKLADLTKMPGFRLANPREEHFAPLWVAAGAGQKGESRVIADIFSAQTIAFGI